MDCVQLHALDYTSCRVGSIIVLSYSICFMLITAGESVLFGTLSGYITFEWNSFTYLIKKCMEIAMLTAFAVMPLLAAAAAGKGYILPICVSLAARMKRGYWLALIFAEIYSFAGLFASMSETLKPVYPITAVFQLSGYYEATIGSKVVSLVILIVCTALAALILTGLTHRSKKYIYRISKW